MRSLGTIETRVQPDVRLELTSRDGATTYVHCKDDFVSMTPIEWEIPFAGGLGKPSGYEVVLSLPLETIKARLADYNRAEVRLRVDVSSHAFQPHSGRVRSFRRQDDDPNLLTLQIADLFLDDDPVLPVESIVSSFADAHPREVDADAGYPLYYGLHHRPFYFTATDCDVDVLFGPRNVSSENHVNSVWFNTNFNKGDATVGEHVILVNKTWAQESGATNAVSGGFPFEIRDGGTLAVKFWEFTGQFKRLSATPPDVDGDITLDNFGYVEGIIEESAGATWHAVPIVRSKIPQDVFNLTNVDFFIGTSSAQQGAVSRIRLFLQVDSGSGNVNAAVFSGTAQTSLSGDIDVSSNNANFFKNNQSNYFRTLIEGLPVGGAESTFANSFALRAQLASEGYKRYSIFSSVINSADVAISANPIGILDHVFSAHTATPFLQDQSSAPGCQGSS